VLVLVLVVLVVLVVVVVGFFSLCLCGFAGASFRRDFLLPLNSRSYFFFFAFASGVFRFFFLSSVFSW
jgi:hypothetical protein